MAKVRRQYRCGECSAVFAKWAGRCSACGAWNQISEAVPAPAPAPAGAASGAPAAAPAAAVRLVDVPLDRGGEVRVRTGIRELDTVLGGGLVAGSLVLLGGDPGVGKSTLLLAALDGFARRGVRVLYASGEESLQQLRLRAQRLGIQADTLWLAADTDFSRIEAVVRKESPRVVVVDSVQTMQWPSIESAPGSVPQIREVAHRAMHLAKGTGVGVILVGHVTKSGELAGPKVLEHLVDTVLQFEGDPHSGLRVLRASKNRFGAVGEVGLFEMGDGGLAEVPDASARLLAERASDSAGTAVTCAVEGNRAMLVEVQALVGRPGPQTPARTCVGVDRARVLMIAAVLQKAGIPLHDRDLFVNAAGGVRLGEPAADLAIAAAIASSLLDRPVPPDLAWFGEVGLVGEVRATSHGTLRVKEAARHGFRRVVVPSRLARGAPEARDMVGVATVGEALGLLDERGWGSLSA